MPRLGDSETRTVPVAVLKAFAGLLLLLWLTLGAAFVLVDWPVDGPRGQGVAHGLMFAVSLVVAITAAQLWRIAVGSDPAMSARDARGLVGGFVLIIPAMTLMWMDFDDWAAWRITAVAVLFATLLVLSVVDILGRRRHKGEIVAPITAMTVRTARGDREVRIAQPEGLHDRWMTRWSIGTPQGTVQRVSYGPDPMRSLTAALADAEATVAVI
ncbi:DUF6968 family protein [Tsukamurella paurometabola]|uniref:DUF6968 domain-containing protein n=1 Tax=Tsukamurella paurometabola TaxID=2061 RepID=A0A3P8JZ24_TSUPA|nr:hypothetical protein [Tsukamurella paurometabola]UEA85449.1 hypothetical protein LK411_11790 [Tsukamurella paurometabola]VDR38074.1 Uncharacterised protein [Tsukamurella paurometabola]